MSKIPKIPKPDISPPSDADHEEFLSYLAIRRNVVIGMTIICGGKIGVIKEVEDCYIYYVTTGSLGGWKTRKNQERGTCVVLHMDDRRRLIVSRGQCHKEYSINRVKLVVGDL